jgi:hypothetical protein
MKYLKTFETISNSIWNIEKFKKVWGFEPEDFEDSFVEMVDDLNLNAKVYWYTIGNNSLELKIQTPTEANSDLHGWFNENIKPRLERIKTELKTKYGIQYSGYQVGLTYQEGDQSFYYKLIWYKTSLLPLSKRNESFEYHGQKYAEEICDQWGVIDLEDLENLFLEFADEGQVLIHPMIVNKEIQVTVHKIWQDLDDSDWLYNPLWDSRFERIRKQLNRLRLDLNVETKNLNQRFVSVRIFQMTNRNRKHTKTDVITESFEMKLGTMYILNKYGLTKDDIEELFLEFSDMGYHIKMLPGLLRTNQLYVDILDVGKKSYEPEFSELIRKVIRESTKLGLYMVESPKRVTQFPDKLNLRFIFNK